MLFPLFVANIRWILTVCPRWIFSLLVVFLWFCIVSFGFAIFLIDFNRQHSPNLLFLTVYLWFCKVSDVFAMFSIALSLPPRLHFSNIQDSNKMYPDLSIMFCIIFNINVSTFEGFGPSQALLGSPRRS